MATEHLGEGEGSNPEDDQEDGGDLGHDAFLPVEDFIGPEEHPTRLALRRLYDAVTVLLSSGEVESSTQLDIALENAWAELMWTEK